MKAHCPKCGASAKFVSQKPHTINFAEVVFRCENPKCGGEVLGEITFSMRKPPQDQCFTAAGSDGNGRIKTDC